MQHPLSRGRRRHGCKKHFRKAKLFLKILHLESKGRWARKGVGRRLWEGEGTMTEQVRNKQVQGQLLGPGGKGACLTSLVI